MHGNIKKMLNSQNNLEKEQKWRCHTPQFQTMLQSHSHLAWCWRKSRLIDLWNITETTGMNSRVVNLWQEYTVGKKAPSITGVGKTGQLHSLILRTEANLIKDLKP